MSKLTRRDFGRSTLALFLLGPTACASVNADGKLALTPSQAEGPYYPVDFPDDTDNDLVHFGSDAAAQGDWLTLQGRVLDRDGKSIPSAVVEIWEADHRGIYRHPAEAAAGRHVDPNYRGFGRYRTDADGRYEFLSIIPAPYTGRPPHIHVKVKAPGRDVLTTQLYLKGHPDNDDDGWLSWMLFANKGQLLIDPVVTGKQAGRSLHEADFDFVV